MKRPSERMGLGGVLGGPPERVSIQIHCGRCAFLKAEKFSTNTERIWLRCHKKDGEPSDAMVFRPGSWSGVGETFSAKEKAPSRYAPGAVHKLLP